MIDLKNAKLEDFRFIESKKRELKPGEKVRCTFFRAKPGIHLPKRKPYITSVLPKDIFDGHLQTGIYRIG